MFTTEYSGVDFLETENVGVVQTGDCGGGGGAGYPGESVRRRNWGRLRSRVESVDGVGLEGRDEGGLESLGFLVGAGMLGGEGERDSLEGTSSTW